MGPLLAVPLVLAQPSAAAEAPPIAVSDPMLALPAPAPSSLTGWHDALSILRERSTDLATARASVDRAQAASRTALASLLPQLNGTFTGTYNLYTSSVTVLPTGTFGKVAATFNGNGTLVQPLFAPRALYAYGTARAGESVARLGESDVKRQTALAVVGAMVSVVSAERVAELNRVGLRGALERLDVAERRRQGGAATGLDVVRAQQDVEAARATLVTGDEQLRQAREALGLAIGVPGQVGVAPAFDAKALEDGARTLCSAAGGVDERSDVAVARESLVVARRALTDAKLQFSPTLNAQSSVLGSALDTGASSFTWNMQAVLSVPLWDGGARYGALRDARGQIDQAQAKLEATRRAATVQIAQANRGVEVAEQALAVATRGRDLAAEVDRLTRRAFTEGSGTSLELVVAASALRQAEINLALKDFDLLRAKLTAALALANCEL